MGVLEQPSREDLCRAVAGADIAQVHFWNTPELYAFLRMAKPAARILVWIHVAGDSAPQVVTDDLFHVADWVLASSPYTAELPVFARQAAAGQTPHSMVWLTAATRCSVGMARAVAVGMLVDVTGSLGGLVAVAPPSAKVDAVDCVAGSARFCQVQPLGALSAIPATSRPSNSKPPSHTNRLAGPRWRDSA